MGILHSCLKTRTPYDEAIACPPPPTKINELRLDR
jgi:hypothetical protein